MFSDCRGSRQAIFREHLFFQRCKAWTSVYADLWVEITNKFLRHYAGDAPIQD